MRNYTSCRLPEQLSLALGFSLHSIPTWEGGKGEDQGGRGSSLFTRSLSEICVRVSMMRSGFSTAKAGKLMIVRSPASISLELDSRGKRELSFVYA